jgi:prevent-host-death family protein
MRSTTYSIKAGAFKAKCLDLMDQVNEKHISITITKHGKAVARLVPIDQTPISYFGYLKDKITINADITKPIEDKWEANQ